MPDPHHAHLDLDVINNSHTPGASPPYLRLDESRNTPFLDGGNSEYCCSIVRFTIQTGNTLPVFIPLVAMQNNQTLPVFRPNTALNQLAHNMTIYTVSLTYTYQNINYTSTKREYYNPKSQKTAPIPAPPLLKQDFSI
jgi:hypothetical protein